jgi:hypothetical protein
MHELFANILAKRDLSRAGELFSIEDELIVDDINEVVSISSLFTSKEMKFISIFYFSCSKFPQSFPNRVIWMSRMHNRRSKFV